MPSVDYYVSTLIDRRLIYKARTIASKVLASVL